MNPLLSAIGWPDDSPDQRQILGSWPSLAAGLTRLAIAVGSLLTLTATPGLSADRILVNYGILERSIAVEDLEEFAITGELNPQLQLYAQQLGLDQEQLALARQVLTTRADLGVVPVAQFLYTPQGKLLLKQLSEVVQTPSRRGGFSAMRGALILAASDPDQGLTLLNFFRQFPGEAIRIDIGKGLVIANRLQQAVVQSERAISLVQNQAAQMAALENADTISLPVALALIQTERRYGVIRRELIVPGLQTPVDLYLPVGQGSVPTPENAPLILISHGLGSNRTTFAYLAEYLTTAGFAVAAIEHPGSNDRQLFALQEGLANFVIDDQEFFDRPEAISLTLDTLERESQGRFLAGRLNLEAVGFIGQSFGGYTGLALTGATFDRQTLARHCPPPAPVFNLSLLIQCQSTLLSDPDDRLIDPRIQAAFLMNPIGSALFGPEGYGQITIPTMVVAGTGDTVAPAFPEQIQPFTWLTTAERYLLLMGGGTHFSVIGEVPEGEGPIPVPVSVIGADPALARTYMEVFTLAFFEAHLQDKSRYRELLTAGFAQQYSREPLPLSLIQALSPEQLEEGLNGESPEPETPEAAPQGAESPEPLLLPAE